MTKNELIALADSLRTTIAERDAEIAALRAAREADRAARVARNNHEQRMANMRVAAARLCEERGCKSVTMDEVRAYLATMH